MGQYGTYTGLVRWFDPVNKVGHLLVLKNGDLQTDITGDYWASGATGYDTGEGFWLDKSPITIPAGSPVGLLLALTHATQVDQLGKTRVFIGNATGNKITWDGTNLTIVGAITATSGAIGGWTIGATALYLDTGTAATSAGMSPADYPFYAGATYANRATAPWRVTPAGKMYIRGTLYVSQAGGFSFIAGSNWATEPTGDFSVIIGHRAGEASSGERNVHIGYLAGYNSSTAAGNTFVGPSAGYNSSVSVSVAIGGGAGEGSTSGAENSVFVGPSAGYGVSGAKTIAIGHEAGYASSGAGAICFGYRSGYNNTYENVVLVGAGSAATANQQIVFGSDSFEYTDLYGGGGVVQSGPPDFRINATGGTGTDIAGGSLKLAGGKGTGSGAGGSVVIQTAPAGSSGTTAGTLADRLTVRSTGEVEIANWLQFPEITEPDAPANNYGRLYMKDNGSGKSQLCVRFATGSVQVLATEP